ncbi:MAG: hypothetical protein KJ674_05055 [Nanoarchaeota archaeon]|nr:hypothetical protein [Nanoarchaeota archaeon]
MFFKKYKKVEKPAPQTYIVFSNYNLEPTVPEENWVKSIISQNPKKINKYFEKKEISYKFIGYKNSIRIYKLKSSIPNNGEPAKRDPFYRFVKIEISSNQLEKIVEKAY